MNAAKEQAIGAHRLPELRDAEAAAAAAFQRLSIARAQIEEEAGRIRARQAELDKRIAQLDADIAREEQMLRDNADILQRLADEEATLSAENAGAAEREDRLQAAVDEAAATLAASEAALAETDRRARRSGRRAQPDRAHAARRRRAPRPPRAAARRCRARGRRDRAPDRRARRSGRKAGAGRGRRGCRWPRPSRQRLPPKRPSPTLRQNEATLRAPLQEARAELARIETEARTLAKILNAATGDLFPAVLEQIKVERGYETALGAALGEDLDVPLDRSAPAHWGGSEPQPGDPALPQEALPLASVVSRRRRSLPAGWRRSASSVAADGRAAVQTLLAPGQRLVSRDGALWRWDGLVAGADAPTAAAQRLAQKNRLAELDAEAVAATQRAARGRAGTWPMPSAHSARATEAERAARQGWRDAQHRLDAARDALQKAERAAGELDCPPRGACRIPVPPQRGACRGVGRSHRGRSVAWTQRPT